MLRGPITEDLHKQALREAQRREESAMKDMAIAKSLRARVAFINYEYDLAASLAEEAAKLDPKYSEQVFKYREVCTRSRETDVGKRISLCVRQGLKTLRSWYKKAMKLSPD